jgi:hypothetical protein
VNSAGQTGCCPRSETIDGGKIYSLNDDGTTCDFTCFGEYAKSNNECVAYADCAPIYKKRKNADGITDYVDDYRRHIYEQESVTPTTGVCPPGDKTESELWADRSCQFNLDSFYCCADSSAVIENNLCKKSCDRCIYETQEQMDRRLASSSGGGNIYVSQTVITGAGATTPSPYVPDQIIYYRTCDDAVDLYYNTSTSSYPACISEPEPSCPTGYVKTKDSQSNVFCSESTEKVCHKFKDSDGDDYGIHYEIRTFNTVGADCPSGWQSERFDDDCPTGYRKITRPEVSNEYVYSTDNSNYYVCCLNSSEGSNISFDELTKKCELTECDTNEEPTGNADGSCQCIQTYQEDTTYTSSNLVTKYTLQDNTSTPCRSRNDNLPSNSNIVCKTLGGSNYCCPEGSDKPYGTDESNYTCEDVWTSNIKPKGFVGFNEEAIVYHKIDYALANRIDNDS